MKRFELAISRERGSRTRHQRAVRVCSCLAVMAAAALLASIPVHAATPIGNVFYECEPAANHWGGVGGWACDADDYDRPLKIRFFEGSTLIGEVSANVLREDAVGNACGGAGSIRHKRHGFWWTIPDVLRDNAIHNISVRAIDPNDPGYAELGPIDIQCAPPSTDVGFWDEGIVNGKTRSDYGDAGCPGHAPLDMTDCAFLPSGGAKPFYSYYDWKQVQDTSSVHANFDNCPTSTSTCHPSALGNAAGGIPCATNSSNMYPSCNTFVDPPGWVESDYWVLDVNSEPHRPYGPYLPNNWSCVTSPTSKLGPPNKGLPVGGSQSSEQLQLWRTFSSCTGAYTINMSSDLRVFHPCETSTMDFLPFFGFGADRFRGNGKPIAVFKYPPDNTLRRKGIQFTHAMKATHTRTTTPPTQDIHRARLLLGAHWNGIRRWLFIEMGGVEDAERPENLRQLSTNWNWTSKDSRMWPGTSIAYEPVDGAGAPFVDYQFATTNWVNRVITVNVEDVFAAAIDQFMWSHEDYPGVTHLDRYQNGENRPTPGTTLYLTDMMIAIESARRDLSPGAQHSRMDQRIRGLKTVELQ